MKKQNTTINRVSQCLCYGAQLQCCEPSEQRTGRSVSAVSGKHGKGTAKTEPQRPSTGTFATGLFWARAYVNGTEELRKDGVFASVLRAD